MLNDQECLKQWKFFLNDPSLMTSAQCGLFLLQQQRTAQSAVSQCEDVSRALDAHTDHTNRALSFNYTNQAKKNKTAK